MKVECPREQLTDAITLTERIAGKHPTLPILNCVLLSVQNNSLTIRSTNLELGIEVEIPVKASAEGAVVVPAAAFLNTLLNTYTQSVLLEVKNNNLLIKTPNSETIITTVPPDDFPTLPTIGAKPFSIQAGEFLKGIKAVWYAASTSTIKPELGSVYLYPEGNTLVFVATDSFRLAEKTIPTKHTYNFKPLLLPLRAVPEVLRILERSSGEIQTRVSEHQISFAAEGVYLTSRIVEGAFPDYHQIIPKARETQIVLLKQDLLSALKKALVFSGKFNQVSMEVNPKKKQFTISAKSDLGETTEHVGAAVSGEEIAMHFNLKYLMDCFQGIAGDSVSLSFSGTGKPLVVRDSADASFLYLVMPMNR
ncbi:MAG TPA: DNA polymerase III subunit beta [Candidatus Paceibacterota bacterium]